MQVAEAETQLRRVVRGLHSTVVALSGGVDSSVVAAIAAQELGSQALAVTGVSPSLAALELDAIGDLCNLLGIAHHAVSTFEHTREAYVRNAPDRCYHCKSELYDVLAKVARERGLRHVIDGTNADDITGHRPGKRAADERGVLSPLLTIGAGKMVVRELASRLGLPNAERPSSPCLSSRIAYGVQVTPERVGRVGRAEAVLHKLGFREVRVRLHDTIARIEVPRGELGLVATHAETLQRELRALGFTYVTLDLGGLRSGSLLEVLRD